MTGYLACTDSVNYTLPVLTEWEVYQTDGDPCGSLYCTFPCRAEDVPVLEKAVRLRAVYQGQAVFTGMVDEYEITLDGGGLQCTLSCRDPGALLRARQVRAAEFQTAQLRDILDRYVTPLGITQVQADPMGAIQGFAVDTGSTCWQALSGFCLHAAAIRPRFLADGTLWLRRGGGKTVSVGSGTGLTALRWRACRCDRVSEVVEVDAASGVAQHTYNDALPSGGQTLVSTTRGMLLRAGARTARQRIEQAEREACTLSITLPGAFLAAPGDTAQIDVAGVQGSFTVSAVRTSLDADGLLCTLELWKGA